mgnify:CR=1 FL=1
MKKIVSAAIATSLLAGAAFAADAKITLNLRQQGTAWDWTKTTTSPKVGDETISENDNWVNFNAYGGSADSFKFVLNGDVAGATLELNPDYTNGTTFTVKQYNAWLKFGDLKLSAGKWGDGFADGNYRVKKDVDAQNANGQDFERYKLGSMFTSSPTKFMDNITNSSAASGVAEYGIGLGDSMKLNLAAAAFSDGGYSKEFDEYGNNSTHTYNAGWAARAQFNIDDVLNSELIFRKANAKKNAFGLYVMPKITDALTLNIGGAVGTVKNGGKDKDGKTDDELYWNVDLRLRYQVTDAFSITTFHNISAANSDGGQSLDAGIAGVKGSNGFVKKSSIPVKTAMWNNISGRFKINDTLTATLNVGLITALADNELATTKNAKNGLEWRVTPAVQIYAASNASIWTGIALSGSTWTTEAEADLSVFSVAVPVLFRVKM